MGSKRKQKQAKRKSKQARKQKQDKRKEKPASKRSARKRRNSTSHDHESYEPSIREAIESAQRILSEEPMYSRSLLLLAREAATFPSERLALLEQAHQGARIELQASEGEDVFESLRGVFYGVHETRPYMRTRLALASAQLAFGRTEQAFEHFQDMLELCPSDNLLVRPCLASAAIELGKLDIAERVCEAFAEDGLGWLPWTRALLSYAQHGGEHPTAREWLERACAHNPCVVECLVRARPPQEPSVFSPGSKEEAEFYAVTALQAWTYTPGALRWLLDQRALTDAKPPRALLPRSLAERLGRLPQGDSVWRVISAQMPGWLEEEQAAPWATMVLDSQGFVVGCDVYADSPSVPDLWDACKRAMLRPMAPGKPCRPRAIQIAAQWASGLGGALAALGIDVAKPPQDDVSALAPFSAMAHRLGQQEESPFPAWTLRPGVGDEHVRALCAAATNYFQRTPWHRTPDSVGFVLSPSKHSAAAQALFGDARPCAVVMGAAARTYGLALYDDVADALAAQDWKPGRAMPPGTTVTFDPPGQHHPQDLERYGVLGCDLPGTDALPMVYRLEGGDPVPVAPHPDQLSRLEAALQVVPFLLETVSMKTSRKLQLGTKGEVQVTCERVSLLAPAPAPTRLPSRGGWVRSSEPDFAADDPLSGLPDRLPPLQPHSEQLVLPAHARTYADIVDLLREFFTSHPHLGAATPCETLAAILCSIPDSPVASGYPRSWAAGIAHSWLRSVGALGYAIRAPELAQAFGVGQGNSSSKARVVDEAIASIAAEDGIPF